MEGAIKSYALALASFSVEDMKEVLENVFDMTETPEHLRPVMLSFNAKLVTELRELKAWPPYLRN